jgi:hypothetical protein
MAPAAANQVIPLLLAAGALPTWAQAVAEREQATPVPGVPLY